MLISIVVELRALHQAQLRGHMGRANYAIVLGMLDQLDAALAVQAHACMFCPVTVSGLRGSTAMGIRSCCARTTSAVYVSRG